MKRVIKGYEKFKAKSGNMCCAIFCESEFQKRDGVEQVGTKYETVMCFEDASVINEKAVGHELAGYFGYNKGTVVVQAPCVL